MAAGDKLVRPLNAPAAGNAAPGVQPGATSGVFVGRLVIIFGPAGEPIGLFVYAQGTVPGPGNPPVISVTLASSDPYGNPVDPGVTAADALGHAVSLIGGLIQFSAGAQISSNSSGGLVLATLAGEPVFIPDGPVTATGGTPAAPTVIETDTPNSVTPPAGFTGSIVYQLLPDAMVSVDVRLAVASTVAAGTVALVTGLGAAYQPARDQRGPVGFFPNGVPSSLANLTAITQMRWEVTAGGTLNVLAFVGGAAGSGVTELDFTISYPLE